MKITCPYCGNIFEDGEEKCPHCGAPNDQKPSGSSSEPVSIEALQNWYAERHLPPYSVTRFFIGENTREPRAFGIYRSGEKVIVYKNKDNGQRVIRYEGSDEAHAVGEILAKLKEEILRQKELNFTQNSSVPAQSYSENTASQTQPLISQSTQSRKSINPVKLVILAIILYVVLSTLLGGSGGSSQTVLPQQGYYNYNGNVYYHQNESANPNEGWYSYNGNNWVVVPVVPSGLYTDSGTYFNGSGYSSQYNNGNQGSHYSDFSNSQYYTEDSWTPAPSGSTGSSSSSSWSSSSDSNNDYNWDSNDSWSDSGSDFSSDW